MVRRGFNNKQNSCFLNSLMQSLLVLAPFVQYVQQRKRDGPPQSVEAAAQCT